MNVIPMAAFRRANLAREYERTIQMDRAWDAALAALSAHDNKGFDAAMKRFRELKATSGDKL